jgi:subtilase family serine protease
LQGLFRLGLVLATTLAIVPAANGANEHANYHAVCPGAVADSLRCHAQVVTDERGNPLATSAPTGLGPADFASAYNLSPSTGGAGQTIAIVDAYDDPSAESDLGVFSSTYGLPPCTTANGCFTKVNQNGAAGPLPRKDAGWALEIALDVETAHGICPNCKILLVEASSNSFANLMTAVDTAARSANVVSNSYGAGEFSGETTYDSHFDHPGVAITVSSGDGGYAAEYPAASRFVTAVGGTFLSRASNARGWSESAWTGAGSGCSAYEPKQSWQTDGGCSQQRTVADVSADADPASGASVYDTTRYQGQAGWFKVGGTSLSAPLVAGVYGLAGNAGSTTYGSYPYRHAGSLFDVTSGSNGSCGGSYLCTAMSGYDGPTGLGTPNGTGGF